MNEATATQQTRALLYPASEAIVRGLYEGWAALVSDLENADFPEVEMLRDLANAYRDDPTSDVAQRTYRDILTITSVYNAFDNHSQARAEVVLDVLPLLPRVAADAVDAYIGETMQIRSLLQRVTARLAESLYAEAF